MRSSTQIIKDLNNGILPTELSFKSKTEANEDPDFWYKIQFHTFWRDPSYWAQKFPDGWEHIPWMTQIFENMAINAKSPLEEILEKQNKNNVEHSNE
jgi:hypothetical protein